MRGDEQEPDTRCGIARNESARYDEVLHPQRGMLYKSGVYALKVLQLTTGDLLCVGELEHRERSRLRDE